MGNYRGAVLASTLWLLVGASAAAEDLINFFPSLITSANPTEDVLFDAQVVRFDGETSPLGDPNNFLAGGFDAGQALGNLSAQSFSDLSNQVPIGSTVAAFTFAFDPALNVFVRSTEGLGPIFGERAETTGRGKLNMAISYSRVSFDTLEKQNLDELDVSLIGTTPTTVDADVIGGAQLIDPNLGNAVFSVNTGANTIPLAAGQGIDFSVTGCVGFSCAISNPFVTGFGPVGDYSINPVLPQVTLDAKIDVDVFAMFFNYGVTDRLDIGLVVPYLEMKLDGTVTIDGLFDLQAAIQSVQGGGPVIKVPLAVRVSDSASASGFGDLILRAKYWAYDGETLDLTARADVYLPTGNEDDLLGLGDPAVGFQAIASARFGRFSPHANIGVLLRGGGGQQHAFRYLTGCDVRLHERASASVDYVFTDDTHNDGFGDTTHAVSTGVKFNPWARLVVSANVLWALDERGLRSDLIPTIGVEYTFR